LMGNHYHLLLETPEANLVAGMKWLQGTYTQRFNVRHKQWGHLLQGRYKALNVDGVADYFLTVSNYIHLNPARAGLIGDRMGKKLAGYKWSSFPLYLDHSIRPEWLCVERTLGCLDLMDCDEGLEAFAVYMNKRVAEVSSAENPHEYDARWAKIRRGWYFGDEAFRKELLGRLDEVVDRQAVRGSLSGEQMRAHDELEAERLIEWGLDRLGVEKASLVDMKKSAPEKQVLAWLIRSRTIVSNQWISDRLCCGHVSNISTFVRSVKRCEEGGKLFELRELLQAKG